MGTSPPIFLPYDQLLGGGGVLQTSRLACKLVLGFRAVIISLSNLQIMSSKRRGGVCVEKTEISRCVGKAALVFIHFAL